MNGRRTAATDPFTPDGRLDWSRARFGDPLPCQHCGRPTPLRHPVSGRASHKVCDDAQAKTATTERTAA